MCNNHILIDDDLDDVFGPLPEGHEVPEITEEQHAIAKDSLSRGDLETKPGEYVEDCEKCRGTGRYHGPSQHGSQCFACKGKGRKVFKTSPEERERNRKNAAERRAQKEAEKATQGALWLLENKAERLWLNAAAERGFGFAQAMIETLAKYGHLTDNQLAAVHRCMAQDEQRDKERAEIAERAPDIKEAALDKIHAAFGRAIDKDIKFPKMRLDAFLFSLVRSGRNAGAIYVKTIAKDDDGERRYLGKIVEGRFFKGWKVSDEEQQRIVAAASDPEAAAIAYGRREGACSICGRGLTNHESIDRGIGPICAENFGW